jgi:D-beta-D-heptose 7-phosphate kinase/D-beta-D-heptose 1-phosphate adenosyltransferase
MVLTDLLLRLKNVKVLVIGDVMLDHYIWGDVLRISPEAPVPVVNANKDTYTAGGAANVALNLANLGIKTSVLGYCTNDEAGARLFEIFNANGIAPVLTNVANKAPTIIKTRVIIRGQQLCRIDREASRELYNIEATPDFDSMLAEVLDKVDAVIISDYAKGVITQSLVKKIIQHPKVTGDGLLIAVDPKPSRKLDYSGVGLITPNRSEGLEMAEINLNHYDDPYPLEEVCININQKYHPKMLVITLGAEGMAICSDGKIRQHLPTVAKQVFDVSGAGDTVIAILTASLAAGANVVEAATLANIAAGCVVSHMGTAPVTREELMAAIHHFEEN